jgi:hypothetical protein
MYNNIPVQLWMLLDKPIRLHLVTTFEIPMTGVREIIDDRVITDGHSNEDLKAISLEKMTTYIGSEETFPRAWEITCSKAKGEVYPPINLPTQVIPMADEPKEELAPTGEALTITSENIPELINKAKNHDNTKKSK